MTPLQWLWQSLAWVLAPIGKLYIWCAMNALPPLTESERRAGEARTLRDAAEVLSGLTATDPQRAALARTAVRAMMKLHYPEEERKLYAHDRGEGLGP